MSDKIKNLISDFDLSDEEQRSIVQRIYNLKEATINILVTGATGCGKSSTINAIFQSSKAKVGIGVDPETMNIQKYEFENLILWDSPGLGDGKEADTRHAKNIIAKLTEVDDQGHALVDVVLVILDGSTRDLGTSYELINSVIIPNLGPDKSRLLVAINQADQAMKGKGWDESNNCPTDRLESFLKNKVDSTKRRIKEATDVDVQPIYYCAGYSDEFEQAPPYNLGKLYSYILAKTPVHKRILFADKVSDDPQLWKDNDDLKDYAKEIKKSYLESIYAVFEGAKNGAVVGGGIGAKIAGPLGAKFGTAIGGVLGAGKALLEEIF
ncbi:GTPase family protein [Sansalvadorimonas verongulae]|uniref:GTPase family protein n=1 Tax=Sansalvadorimonas verongulae TaxID=2172824 RepID=UPI001E540037|nr:GTPase [Sansalvadorimonas verongulae]